MSPLKNSLFAATATAMATVKKLPRVKINFHGKNCLAPANCLDGFTGYCLSRNVFSLQTCVTRTSVTDLRNKIRGASRVTDPQKKSRSMYLLGWLSDKQIACFLRMVFGYARDIACLECFTLAISPSTGFGVGKRSKFDQA